MERSGNLTVPFVGSVVLHALLLLLFVSTAMRGAATPTPPLDIEIFRPEAAPPSRRARRAPKAAERRPAPPEHAQQAPAAAPPAEAAPEMPRVENQMVSPPEGPEAVPDKARLLSEKNSRADQEMVKRGEPAPPAAPPKSKPQPKAQRAEGTDDQEKTAGKRGRREAERQAAPERLARAEPPPVASAPLPGLKDLFAKPADVLRRQQAEEGSGGEGSSGTGTDDRDLANLRRPDLWADPGERGIPDYLPDVRSGRFTLLNTKADLFAPFVRRVGLRVFQTFSMTFKRQILSGEVPQGKEKVEIEAIMTPDGRRVQVYLRDRSGNLSTDRVLLGTLSDEIFFDENPPRGALADDGRIHFVFALDAAVWYQPTEGGRIEPGAHWIFAAGLL
ncbi:MAG: hypothetical protein QOD06_2201 [Candidatus Binatota bacterium]|nr:hypothetical protein [Candidatus Binatota bacterium]